MNILNSQVLRELGTLSRCIHTFYDMKFKKMNLQKGQFIYLTRVCEDPGINQNTLIETLKLDKTTATKAIQKLERDGFLVRKTDTKDKRARKLYPTDKAIATYPSIIVEENRYIELCFQDFNEKERQAAYELIKRMRANVENEWINKRK